MARKMKDSGIEWIGEIPEGWSIARGKHILTLLQRAVSSTDGVITCFRDGEVTLRSNRREDGFTVSLKEIGYQGIEPGDLVVHGMDGFAGSIGISDSRGKSSPVLVVLDSSQDKKYLMYYLRSMAYNNVFLALSTGIRVRSCDLKWNKLADLLYLVPPIVEQHKLVSFLDEKCSEIDAMLSKTRSSIEEYKKLKQAVITQAVTKGVRGEREMKDSGVEWIGEIPKEWGRTKIKMIASFFNGDRTSRYPQPSDFVDSGVAFLTSRNIGSDEVDLSETKYITEDKYKSLSGAKIQIDDIIFCLRGSVGKCAINRTLSCGTVASSLATIRPKDIYPKYLLYFLLSNIASTQTTIFMNGTCAANLSAENVGNYYITLPISTEQKEIADYLDAKCAEIDGLIAKKEQLVKELESYKKSLIYEVVTGKREV